MTIFPYETRALRIVQPLGTFFVVVLPVDLLLRVAGSDRVSATMNFESGGYMLSGTQRAQQEKRFTEIASYINRVDASFPNSIILAANYNTDLGIDQDEIESIAIEDGAVPETKISKVWTIESDDKGLKLIIPTEERLAAIIDGQHRLLAFRRAEMRTHSMELLCSVFLDLPKALQAQLFATINSTQKPVDRSLTYELFGYNVSDEPEEFWTPDKLAVFLTRKLGTDDESLLKGRITVAPKRDEFLESLTGKGGWRVSTAVVVDGILRLISSNPKRDANAMRKETAQPRSILKTGAKDKSPLREVFISGNDSLIYRMVANYIVACDKVFWSNAGPGSYIVKTVGVQALFDILRKMAPSAIEGKDLRAAYFEEKLQPASGINFADAEFQVPSGSGRSAIRRAIEAVVLPAPAAG
jgi:DNA phosphorothioation-associated DGQHR protein 1